MTKQLPSLTLVRRIKASPAKVFAALTQPELMVLSPSTAARNSR